MSFRQFSTHRVLNWDVAAISCPACPVSGLAQIPHPAGGEFEISSPPGRELVAPPKNYPLGGQFPPAFSPQLTWSHYRALMRVDSIDARDWAALSGLEWMNAMKPRALPWAGLNRPLGAFRTRAKGAPMTAEGNALGFRGFARKGD